MTSKILVSVTAGLILTVPISATGLEAQYESNDCTGLVGGDPTRMYDFKIGKWDINWRIKSGPEAVSEFTATSVVTQELNGDILVDVQVTDAFKGITFRTYDHARQEWVVRWLPANNTWLPPISAKLENCVPVERHEQPSADGKIATVRTSFTNITADRFEFHQDWSMDEGETWIQDVLFYEAIRSKEP